MPRTRTEMRRIREVLRLKFQFDLNDTQVATSAGIARATVQDYLRRIAATGLNYEQLIALERELRSRGVTLRLLWLEYLDGHANGYQYTQFLRHFRAWQRASRPPVMRQVHRAGETLEVDCAGMTLMVIDMGTPRSARPSSPACHARSSSMSRRPGPRGTRIGLGRMCGRWPTSAAVRRSWCRTISRPA
jgi:hypothetical protein